MKNTIKLVSVILLAIVAAFGVSAVEITDFSQITDMEGIYELVSDITIPSDFTPIGSESEPFAGTLDGKGHKVTGSYSSIFGYTRAATIKNINIENAKLEADTVFGGITAVAGERTKIYNCSFEGDVTVDNDGTYVIGGGIAGVIEKYASVENCYSDVTLSVTERPYALSFGGIAGENDGRISYCYTDGFISSDSDKYRVCLGGMAGKNRDNGFIIGCFNNAAVSGKVTAEASQIFAGGIAGVNSESCYIERCGNTGKITGEGYLVYPAYTGGIVGLNINGAVKIVKNTAVITTVRAIAGGIAGMNLSNGAHAYINDTLNSGAVIKHDSVVGGITALNSVIEKNGTTVYVRYALNLNSNKAVAENQGETAEIYNMGESDGVSTAVTADGLKTDGIPSLENHDKIWVNNTEISALPDMLVVGDERKAQLIASNIGDGGDVAYYLYSPDASGYAKAFTAVYFNGSRYLSMDYVEKAPTEMYARLKATDIPEGTTRIKFIAFAETFGASFKPAEVLSTEIAYTK